MRIALCDDDMSALCELNNYIEDFFVFKKITFHTDCFLSAEEYLNSDQNYDILFMDIYFQGINGIDAVKKTLKSHSPALIFTTYSPDYALDAFLLKALHYLLKPVHKEDVAEALNRCLESLDIKSEQLLYVKNAMGNIPVSVEQIIYIEVSNKISTIHTLQNNLQTPTSLDTLFKALDHRHFMKAQRSYLVNMQFIKDFYFDHIVLKDGTEITLSRSNRNSLKKQYQDYLFDLVRRGVI